MPRPRGVKGDRGRPKPDRVGDPRWELARGMARPGHRTNTCQSLYKPYAREREPCISIRALIVARDLRGGSWL